MSTATAPHTAQAAPQANAPTHPRGFGLDLMRAIAVTLVLACHCSDMFCLWFGRRSWPPIDYGGFLGVEIFFVLSGFLIGRILISVAAHPSRTAWRIFMTRRWLRTLPLYFTWMLVLLLVWPPLFWLPDPWLLRRLHAILLFSLFLQNFAGPVGFGGWYDVSWSLAVEEWFYLTFSALLLAAAARLGRTRALTTLLAAYLMLPALARGVITPVPTLPDSVITNLDQIAIGVATAWVSLSAPRSFRAAAWLAPAGLTLIASFYTFLGPGIFGHLAHLRHVVRFDQLGLGVALCLPALARWQHATGAIAALIRWISARSYGIYLTHLSILEFINYYKAPGPMASALAVLISLAAILALPMLSWRFLEQPMLARRPPQQ